MSKNILITGCSSGLGLALTNYYLQKNYKVFGISRNKPDIKNKNFTFYSFDLSNISLIKKELNDFIVSIKDINTVFLNAGMLGEIKELNKLAIEEMRKVYDLNVYANKEVLDVLANTNTKNIIALSSGASKNAAKGWASYSLSKAGLNMLVSLYSKELVNTKVLSVAPGVIQTPMTDYIRHEIDDDIFTSAKVLKAGVIQKPLEAAQKLDALINRIDEFESGSFVDVRLI